MGERNGIYQRISGDQYRNIWVVGDLHGCYQLLIDRMQQIDFDKQTDLIISVGDLIDRGDQNVECLDLLNEKWFAAIRGNHEQMMLDAMLNGGSFSHWMLNGGGWLHRLDYAQDILLSRSLLPKTAALPLIIEVSAAGRKVVIAHADYPSDEYEFGKPVDEQAVIWSRERVADDMAREINGADLFIFGHTPMIKGIGRRANQEYIDTGAVFGYGLTLRKIQ